MDRGRGRGRRGEERLVVADGISGSCSVSSLVLVAVAVSHVDLQLLMQLYCSCLGCTFVWLHRHNRPTWKLANATYMMRDWEGTARYLVQNFKCAFPPDSTQGHVSKWTARTARTGFSMPGQVSNGPVLLISASTAQVPFHIPPSFPCPRT